MSLSRAELEAMDRDELIETIVDLADTVDNIRATVDVNLQKRKSLEERVAELEAENERLRDRLDSVDADAKAAIRAATADGDDVKKTDVAHRLTRNLLVTRAASGTGTRDRPVTVGEIKDRARPDHVLKWQTVRDAWDNLLEEWPQFHETTKDGDQALSIRTSKVTPALARIVEADLDRDDLTKAFVGGDGGAQP